MDSKNSVKHFDESASNNNGDDDDTSDVQVEEEYIEVVGSDQDEEDNNVKIEEAPTYKHGSTDHHTVHDETPHMQCRSGETEVPGKQAVCSSDKLTDKTQVVHTGDGLENLEDSINEECIDASTEVINRSVGIVSSPWVFLVESQRYRDKVIKQFEDKPMSIKRSKQEISESKRRRHVVVHPVPPDVLSDPRLLEIFDKCSEVHLDFHNISSSTDTSSRMAGYLQLWFKCVSDIKENICYLHQLGGSSTELYCELLSEEISYVEFHEAWKEHYQGSLDTTLIVPFLPSEVTEDDLWNIFPLANIIAIPDDCKPHFRYAYVIFACRETLLSAIETANMQSQPSFMKTLHLVPIEYLLLNKEDPALFRQHKSDKQAKKVKEQMQIKQYKSCTSLEEARKRQTTKRTKSYNIVSKKQRSHHPRNKVTPRSYRFSKQTEDMDDYISLANILATLGPEAPDVINSLAKALEKTQFQEDYSNQAHLKTSSHTALEIPKSSFSCEAMSKQRVRKHGKVPFHQQLPREDIQASEQKKQPVQQEKKANKPSWKTKEGKWKCTGEQKRKSKDANVQLQWNAVPPPGWDSGQGSVKSSTEELFDYWTEGLPVFTQRKNKRHSSKTKQNRSPSSPHQHARNNDDWESEYYHSQSRHTRGKTYRELVHAYDFSRVAETSDEYKTWVSANVKDLKKEKTMTSAASGGKRNAKSYHRQ